MGEFEAVSENMYFLSVYRFKAIRVWYFWGGVSNFN